MLGILYLFASQPFRTAAYYVALPYLVMYAAFTNIWFLDKYQKIGDYSYGTYIFAFPVQQSIVATMGTSVGPLMLFAFAAPITLCLAFFSWRFVEHPALQLRRRLFRQEEFRGVPGPRSKAAAEYPLMQPQPEDGWGVRRVAPPSGGHVLGPLETEINGGSEVIE